MKVRTFALIMLFLLGSAFAAGYVLLALKRTPPNPNDFVENIKQAKTDFVLAHKPIDEINADSLLSGRSQTLLRKDSLLPTLHKYPYKEVRALIEFTQNCNPIVRTRIRNPVLIRTFTYEAFKCGLIRRLSKSFFKTDIIHPLGKTFAFDYMSTLSGIRREIFAAQNLAYFHVLELMKIKKYTPHLRSLNRLGKYINHKQFKLVVSGADSILTKAHYLVIPQGTSERSAGRVLIYNRKDLETHLEGTGISLAKARSQCVISESNYCWGIGQFALLHKSQMPLLAILVLLVLAIIISCFYFLRSLRNERADNERRKLALQIISHELRTPISTLTLANESLRSDFESLPERSQKTFLQIANETTRLRRMIDSSKNYLEVQEEGFENEENEPYSLQEFLSEIVANYDGVKVISEGKDVTVDTSRYWLGIAVENLIKNAIQHGKKPIFISIGEKNGSVEVKVVDQGKIVDLTLKEMTEAFKKGEKSFGSGLGLAIADQAVRRMGGKLQLKNDPTSFSFKIKGVDDATAH